METRSLVLIESVDERYDEQSKQNESCQPQQALYAECSPSHLVRGGICLAQFVSYFLVLPYGQSLPYRSVVQSVPSDHRVPSEC